MEEAKLLNLTQAVDDKTKIFTDKLSDLNQKKA
jgi:hypothetical protein